MHADIQGELKKMKSAVHLVRQGDDWLRRSVRKRGGGWEQQALTVLTREDQRALVRWTWSQDWGVIASYPRMTQNSYLGNGLPSIRMVKNSSREDNDFL